MFYLFDRVCGASELRPVNRSEKLKTVTSQSDSYVAVNKADFLDHLEKLDALELDES